MAVSMVEHELTLPPGVLAYMERALPTGAPRITHGQVSITQTGEMSLKPAGRSLRFKAAQRYAVERVAFSWQASFPLGLRVTDAYRDGEGQLSVKLLGLPVQCASGRDVTIGQAYRYLAELIWVPQAIAANRDLEWRTVDEQQVEVATRVAGERIALILSLDHAGDVITCHADARPRGGGNEPAAWGGEFGDYRMLGGIRLPTRGEAYWELPEGRFTYWRGHIAAVEALEEPYE